MAGAAWACRFCHCRPRGGGGGVILFIWFWLNYYFQNQIFQRLHLHLPLSPNIVPPLPVNLHHLHPCIYLCLPIYLQLDFPLNLHLYPPLHLNLNLNLVYPRHIQLGTPHSNLFLYLPILLTHLPYFTEHLTHCISYQYLPITVICITIYLTLLTSICYEIVE